MKNTILIILSVTAAISFSTLQAQEKSAKFSRIYLSTPLAGPDGISGPLSISTVVKKKWIASIGHLSASRDANAPSDMILIQHEYPLSALLEFFEMQTYYELHPETDTKFTYASFGRYYPVSRSFSFILDAGIGLAKGHDFNYYKQASNLKSKEVIIPGVSSNYVVTSTEKTTFGTIARAGVDWAFSGAAGLGLDVYYNYCAGGIDDNMGVNLRLMIGYMPRGAKKKLKQ